MLFGIFPGAFMGILLGSSEGSKQISSYFLAFVLWGVMGSLVALSVSGALGLIYLALRKTTGKIKG